MEVNINLLCDFGAKFARLWRHCGRPGRLWGHLGASWARLGASWRPLGASLVRLVRHLARLGASWARLGTSWARLGCVLARLGSKNQPQHKSASLRAGEIGHPPFARAVQYDISYPAEPP